MPALLTGFFLGLIGAIIGDIARNRLRRIRDRATLCQKLRDDISLISWTAEASADQAEKIGTFGDHAIWELSVLWKELAGTLEAIHLVESSALRIAARDFLREVSGYVRFLDGLDAEFDRYVDDNAKRTAIGARRQDAAELHRQDVAKGVARMRRISAEADRVLAMIPA